MIVPLQGDVTPEARAADLAAHFGLDKSTVSRQLEQLISAGQQHLATAAQAVQGRLAEWLTDWDDRDIAAFGALVSRFNQSTSRTYLAG